MRLLFPIIVALSMCCAPKIIRQDGEDIRNLISSTVMIHVQVEATLTTMHVDAQGNPELKAEAVSNGWAGSGVVIAKTKTSSGEVHSLILTANHVLEDLQQYEVGKVLLVPVEDSVSQFGVLHIDKVMVEVLTADDRICNAVPLQYGNTDNEDTATASVNCDAGRVARIATVEPPVGAKILVIGHPKGLESAIVTEGYVSGVRDGFLVTSAPATHGNSGGPVFYQGEVVGLLVQLGVKGYDHATLTTSIGAVIERVKASAEWFLQ